MLLTNAITSLDDEWLKLREGLNGYGLMASPLKKSQGQGKSLSKETQCVMNSPKAIFHSLCVTGTFSTSQLSL